VNNSVTIARGFKALLLAGGASTIMLAAPAIAQDTPNSAVDCNAHPDDASCTSGNAIVVTGSRIQRKDFEATSPTVTVDDTFLKQSSTGAVEQQLNKLPQFVVSQSSTVKNNEGVLTNAGGDAMQITNDYVFDRHYWHFDPAEPPRLEPVDSATQQTFDLVLSRGLGG
jgi:hypothetical protein